MKDDENTFKNWRVRKTLLQMCHDRGYLVTQTELNETLAEFVAAYGDTPSQNRPSRSDLTILVSHVHDPEEHLVIFFPEESSISIRTIRNYCLRLKDDHIDRAIFVAQDSITPSAKKCLAQMAPTFLLEYFLESELLINVLDHEMVPRHYVLTPDEKKELLNRYKIKEDLLMRIQVTDPVSRYLGLKRGQVVKIVRGSESAGRYITYRFVS